MSIRYIPHILLAAAFVAVLALTVLPAGTSAQEPEPTGELVVVPGSISVGETTLAVGFHVKPFDQQVRIEYSERLAPEGESCGGSSTTTESVVAPTWVTLKACSAGSAHVRLVASDTGHAIAEESVVIAEPSIGGQGGGGGDTRPVVRLSGVASKLNVGDSDGFRVRVTRLDRRLEYELHTVPLNGRSLGFNRGCTDFRETEDIEDSSFHSESYTMYGCRPPGTTVWAYLNFNGSAIAATDIDENRVTVTRATTPDPPTPTPEPDPPTPTPTPTPGPPDPPTTTTVPDTVSRPTVTAGNERLTVKWGEPSNGGSAITSYRVQHRLTTASWSGDGASVGGGTTETDVTGLTNDVAYDVRVRACNIEGCGSWSLSSRGTPRAPNPPPVGNYSPVIGSGPSSVSYPENGTSSVATYTASDQDGDDISWELPITSHATDRDDFTISSDGVLSFRSSPDYESPHDSNGDNVYRVTVWASDGKGGVDDRDVTVTVTNLDEKGSVRLSSGSPQVNSVVSATLSDPDGGVSNPVWQWQRSSDGVTWEHISGAPTGGSYTPSNTDEGKHLRVSVTYDDAHGTGKSAVSDRTNVVARPYRPPPVRPQPPARVEGLMGSPGSNRGEIVLDWQPAARADSYEVQQRRRRLPLLPTYHWVTIVTSTTTSAVVEGLTGGETYRHRVRGVSSSGVKGPWSEHVDTTLTLPARVEGLTGTPGPAHGEITLTWKPTDGATGYEVQQKKPRPFLLPDEWITLPFDDFEVEITGTGAVVRNLDPDKSYEHEVRSVNAHGEGEWSDSVRTTPHDERPDTPQGLEWRSMIGNRGISLSWQAVADAGEYEVESSFGGRTATTTVSSTSVEYVRLTPDALYVFRVRAWKPYGVLRLHSDWSDAFRVRAPTPKHWWGHQADHNVKYVEGSIGNNVIEDAIATTTAEWNSEMRILGKGLKLCSGCDDSGVVEIRAVNKENNSTSSIDMDPAKGCGTSYACVKPKTESSSSGPGVHMGDMYMVFEDPPESAVEETVNSVTSWRYTVWRWTADKSKHGTHIQHTAMPMEYYLYIDPVMLHEFGHTLGLPDFYADTTMDHLDAVMNTSDGIKHEDIEQLRAIYFLHSPH